MAPDTLLPADRTASRIEEALAFDDVLVVPSYSQVLPGGVSTATRLPREIALRNPPVSSALDTGRS